MSTTSPDRTIRDSIMVDEALREAAKHGVRAVLTVSLDAFDKSFLVSVNTVDPAAIVTIVETGRRERSEMFLSARSQSGPERWDYPAYIETQRERLVVELALDGVSEKVPCFNAALSILAHSGWPNEGVNVAGQSAPVYLDGKAFREALERLQGHAMRPSAE